MGGAAGRSQEISMGVTALVQTLMRLDQVEVWMREVGGSWIDLKLRMGWGWSSH